LEADEQNMNIQKSVGWVLRDIEKGVAWVLGDKEKIGCWGTLRRA